MVSLERAALRPVTITFLVPPRLDACSVTSTTWLPSSLHRLANRSRPAIPRRHNLTL